jgi:hypothetical protein
LGVELVAETDKGLMLVASEDIEFAKLEQVLTNFKIERKNLVAASSILDIYDVPDDERRLVNILHNQVFTLWPFEDNCIYILDFGIQTASSARMVKWPPVRRIKGETPEKTQERKEVERRKAWSLAENEWLKKAEARVDELERFVQHYNGEFLSGMMDAGAKENLRGVVFPDSVQVRVKMCGLGIRDVILNFPHLFDVTLPVELQTAFNGNPATDEMPKVEVLPPKDDAPRVCVIDSGIQEEHNWLSSAIERTKSRCFLPDADTNDIADYVKPQGHGTRVAGAVQYPRDIPRTGQISPVAWIQNARVLDANNELPETLAPEEYLQEVVAHFQNGSRSTKIFNHSINSHDPCSNRRMSAWAAKIDQLSHEKDILFIQSAGNETITKLTDHIAAGKIPPQHQLDDSMMVSDPAQSLHALTVGSISGNIFENKDDKSFAKDQFHPSGFSRSGYAEPWSVVKPEVVELGGDLVYSKHPPYLVKPHVEVAIELLNSTLAGSSAFQRDGAGTSFSAPKVSHIAAHLQTLFPSASPLLYRALIVQSARWPDWANSAESTADDVLRLIGYGLPSLERATMNTEARVTLITPEAMLIPSKRFHLYTIKIPEELRNPALEADIRVDVTLSYTALPRRTRARRTGYLETWLDWESSKLGEPIHEFKSRIEGKGKNTYRNFPWKIHTQNNFGDAQGTHRGRGSVQKDWAVFKSFEFPQEFAIAILSHNGWNHRDGTGSARYCLVVSFEAVEGKIPIYSMIESQIEAPAEVEIENEIKIQTLTS